MYVRIIPLIKFKNFRKRKMHITHHSMPRSIYARILPKACWESPERAYVKFIHRSIMEKSCSWDIGRNGLRHSDCRIYKLPFLQNKSMKQPNSLHVDTNSQKLKVDWKLFGWDGLKRVLPISCVDSKIACISRMNIWN